MAKKVIIFDAYGTLLSTGTGSLEATAKILALQEKKIDAQVFYADWKKLHRKHLNESNAGQFVTEEEIFAKDLQVLYERYGIDRPYMQDVQIMLDSLVGRKAFPEVAEAIASLRKYNQVVIGSTTDTVPLMENLQQNALLADAVYTSEIIGKYKPAKEFYEYIFQKEGCKAHEAVFVGDSLTDDIAGPKSVGITTVLVDRKGIFKASEQVQPDYVVNAIDEIVKIV